MSTAGRWGTAAHLGAGLAVLGAAGYAFVALVGHVADSPGALSALISLYLLINIIGPGIFAALEQATSRAVSAALARGEAIRPIARRTVTLALCSFLTLAVVTVGAWPLVLQRVLDGRVGLLVALLVAIAGSAAVYWVRGLLGGQQRFTAYACTLYLEGASRLVACLVLLVLAVRSPIAYGMAFALGSAVAAIATAPLLRLGPDDGRRPNGIGRSYGYLIGAIALSQLLANLAPVVVTYRLPDDLVRAGVFGTIFVLARIPLFLFAPVQAVLLPRLTQDATLGRRTQLVHRLRRILLVVLVLGVLGILGCVALGPWAAEVLFNTATRPSAVELGLLGGATLGMMLALVVQPTLIALERQRAVTLSWIVGAVVYLVVLMLPVDPVGAALAAQIAGPLVVAVLLLLVVTRALRDTPAVRYPTTVASGGE